MGAWVLGVRIITYAQFAESILPASSSGESDAKGEASRSMGGRRWFISIYACFYYAARLIRGAGAAEANLHAKEFTLGIRTPGAIFSRETIPAPLEGRSEGGGGTSVASNGENRRRACRNGSRSALFRARRFFRNSAEKRERYNRI